jgi:H+/gluconate symporter-like permease
MPAAMALGTSTFTMSALPGTPAIQNAIPMPFFGTTPFAARPVVARSRRGGGAARRRAVRYG